MNRVQIIAPTKVDSILDRDLSSSRIKRTAAYCRVSTGSEQQATSFDNQVEEWTKRILENPDYQLVKVYSDSGLSGTSAKGREGFMEMIRDAKAGKIDLILVKSISRFARNTVLTIQTIRELKEYGVEVYFDNEHLSTFDAKNEFMFSIISSMAQEESRHISENVMWTVHKKMNDGIPFITSSNFLGYDLSEDKTHLVINPEQAEIVKLIFDLYDSGMGTGVIARTLKERGIKTIKGNTKWNVGTIQGILRNEKYIGMLILQKTYTVDYLTHKRRENKGQRQKYKVEKAHEPIISIEQWNRVQKRMNEQAEKAIGACRDLSKYNTKHPLSGMIICHHCGYTFKRRTWYKGYPVGHPKIMFQCNLYINPTEKERCSARPISENMLLRMCAEIINTMYLGNTKVFDKISKVLEKTLSTENLDKELNKLLDQKTELNNNIDYVLKERMNATGDVRKTLEQRYQDLVNDYQNVCDAIQKIQDKEADKQVIKQRLDAMLKILNGKEITYDMITKEMLDVFMYRIIAMDRTHVVVVIDGTNTVKLEELRARRKEIAELEPIYSNTIVAKDPKKRATLNYKVVVI